jgi:RimJ/RimL family protein N-acetyltransferase
MEGARNTPASDVRLRPATADDSALVMSWRNDAITVQFSGSRLPVTREEHERWIVAQLAESNPGLFVAEVGGQPVGQIRLQRDGEAGEVHIAVAPESRGRGYAAAMIAALQEDVALLHGLRRLTAQVHADNLASLRLFTGRGFYRTGTVGDFVQFEWVPQLGRS